MAAIWMATACGCRPTVEVEGQPQADPAGAERPPYLSWPEEPSFEKIPGTGVKRLRAYRGKPVGPGYDICKVGPRWYWAYKGHWFYNRRSWRGPWKPARRIPREFLKIPKEHALHRLARLHPDYGK
jgi:hypothetical protein